MSDDGSDLAALVRTADPDRFLTTLFAPALARPALLALYAFNAETARIADLVSDPLVGQIRLQWWREALESLAAGTPPRRHPVVAALAPLIGSRQLAVDPLLAMLEAREAELDPAPFATLAELEAYAEATGGSLMTAAVRLLDPAAPADTGRAAGAATALAGILRTLPHHLERGRVLLPRDALSAAGLDPLALLAGQGLDALPALIRPLHARARALLQTGLRNVGKAAIPALLPVVLARSDLRALARSGFDPFSTRLRRERPGRLLGLVWAGLGGRL